MNIIRKATQQEIDFMHNVMYPLQDEVLACMKSDGFYLTGGTCLSRFYYHHRYSEDLDFFFDARKYSEKQFNDEYEYFKFELEKRFKVEITMTEKTFRRMFIEQRGNKLKVEMVFDPIISLGNKLKKQNFLLDNKENIAANKLTAIFSRKTAKDYFDLFFLLRELDWISMMELSKEKSAPIDYEFVAMALSVNQDFYDTVLMFEEIREEEFQNFVIELNRKLIDYARSV